MSETTEFALRAILIGAGATIVMDVWALLLRQLGVPSLNFAFLGRWIGHLPRGRWQHSSMASAQPVRGESLIGWCAHYSIGITISALLLWTQGLGWARSPSALPVRCSWGSSRSARPGSSCNREWERGSHPGRRPPPSSMASRAGHPLGLRPWHVPRRPRNRIDPSHRQMSRAARSTDAPSSSGRSGPT